MERCVAGFSFFRVSVVLCALLLIVPAAQAQITTVDDTTSTPIEGVGHDYIKMLSETVDPASGGVSLRIHVPTPPGRGISLPFSISYDSNGAEHLSGIGNGLIEWMSNQSEIGSGGWSYSMPLLTYSNWSTSITTDGSATCSYSTNYLFTDLTGGRHTFDIGAMTQATVSGSPHCTYENVEYPSGGDDQFSAELTGICMTTYNCPGAASPLTVYGVDGTAYSFAMGSYPPGALPLSITDRNGNEITDTDSGNGAFTLKDTLGRSPLISSSGFGTSGKTYNLTVFGQTYQITWTASAPNLPLPQSSLVYGGAECTFSPDGTTDGQPVISSITLPNGEQYQFTYDTTYGLLKEIIYPTGGSVQYTWKMSDTLSDLLIFADSLGGYCTYRYAKPVVATRQVSFTGTGVNLTQTFTYNTTWASNDQSWTTRATTIQTTDSVLGQKQTINTYVPIQVATTPYPQFAGTVYQQIPVESEIQYYDWNNTSQPLETVNKGWYDQYSLECDFETWPDGQVSGSFYQYSYGQVSDHREYDYGQLAASTCSNGATLPSDTAPIPARETVSTFESFTGPAYVAYGLKFGRPTSVVTKSSTGTTVAETDYVYDGTSVSTVTATQHDDADFPASFNARGNPTKKTRQCLGCTNAVTTYTYDMTGQVLKMTDPCGNGTCSDITGSSHTTNYSYANNFTVLSGGANTPYTPSGNTNAYLTTITDPLGHIESFTYDFNNGQLTAATDPNSQTTGYVYNDSLFRPTLVGYPDGGQTSVAYNDSPYNGSQTNPTPSVTITKEISSSLNKVTTTAFDGLGHTIETILNSDPDGITYTNTVYYGVGQPYQVYNPYRTTSDSTYGITTYAYDALGRTEAVTEPDGSSVSTSYLGNQTTVTDETGHERISITDGLGRLTEVEEPGTGSQGDTPASGTVTIGGSEQAPIPATQSTGWFTINTGPNDPGGTITLYVNGVTVASQTFASGATAGTVTQSLISAINGNPSSPVTASAPGGGGRNNALIDITSIAYGSATNYTMSGTPTNGGGMTVQASFPGTMTGGADPIYDAGTVSISVSGPGLGGFGFSSSAPYGNGSTPASIAAALYSGFSASGSPVVALLSGSVISLTTIDAGSSSDFQLSAGVSQLPTLRHDFPTPSFTATSSGSTLTGGSNATFGSAPMVTMYSYDDLNDLTCAVQMGTSTTGFTTCAVAPSTWRPRSFVYDSLGRLTSSTNPESNTAVTGGTLVPTTYAYDVNSNLSSKAVPAQNQQGTATTPISYCYDVDNRLTAKSYSSSSSCASPVATYTYDQTASSCYNVGHRTAMTDAAGSESWCYDKMGRVLTDQRTTNGLAKSTTYAYLPYVDGSINTVTYPSGRVVTYTTGKAERLLTASDSSATYASGVVYAPQGAIAELVNNTNLSSTEIYNNRLQPCWMYTTSGTALATSSSCTSSATTGTFQDLKYNFAWGLGDNGNVMGITNNRDTTRDQVFAYDALNRLQSANTISTYSTNSARCWGESYGIDGWGNLQALAMLNSQYTGCNQEPGFSVTASVQNQLPISGNTYDSAGNLWVGMVGGIPYTYTYNAENQMTSVTGLSTTTNYLYDGDGKRAEKTGSKIYWYGADGAVLDETDATGSLTDANFSEYIYFGGKRIARRDSAGDVFYYFADHLGTSRTMAQVLSGQTTGTLCYDADFYPFGGERAYTNICTQNYKFTGKERDTESDLDEFGARYYSSSIGRFTIPDWAAKPLAVPYANYGNPQSLNLYSYVQNKPTATGDPDGHCEPICALETTVSISLGSYLARNPDVVDAFQALGDSMGLKVSLSIGPKFAVGPVKVGLAASVTAEQREDGSEKSKVQVTGGASLNGVGVQGNGTATFAENGSFVNPLKNLDGNVKLTGSGAHGDNINSNVAVGTDGRVAAGPAINAGIGSGGVQVTAGTQQVRDAVQAIGNAVINDVQHVWQDLRTSQTCTVGGCSVVSH
jgi:RHS repeat-associated protein